MSLENLFWGAPRIRGELLKLGHVICEATIARYMARRSGPPPQTWQTFIYMLSVADRDDRVRFTSEGFDLGSLSMRSVIWG